jgi:hypothetical protein
MASKNINRMIASLPGVREAVKDAARRIQEDARALAAGHGGLARNIRLEYPNKFDTDVVLTHENALSIEVGHEDKVFNSGWVPGLHIMRGAAAINKKTIRR